MKHFLKKALPNRKVPCKILRGPFRGARILLNPHHSLRKIFGIYEHELNSWLVPVLGKVNVVIDVGANDGYFTFGCWASFGRQYRAGTIFAFEPDSEALEGLNQTRALQLPANVTLMLVNKFVGSEVNSNCTTLDRLWSDSRIPHPGMSALVKIDVEGAELELLRSASKWIVPGNFFVIEVHKDELLEQIKALFASHNLSLKQINQRPHPLLGAEQRHVENRWLVSEI